MTFTENLPAFFADFGVAATLGGVSVIGIFDEAAADVFGMVAGSSPTMLLPASVAASTGDTLTLGARSFVVTQIEPDGTGMQRLRLETP